MKRNELVKKILGTGKKKTAMVSTLLMTLVMIVSVLVAPVMASSATPGTSPNQLIKPLTITASDPLNVMDTETGKISLSTDGMGVNTGVVDDHGTIRVDKPAGATVRKAYLMSATTGFTNYVLVSGDVLLDGANVFPWDVTVPTSIQSNNYWKDVTSMVKAKIDAAPAGIVNFDIDESNHQTGNIDGEALAVIFDDPAQTTDNTVALLFGAQNVLGDTFNVLLGKPADFTDPKFGIGFGLGISYGYQTPAITNQFSTVKVNGNLLTSSAGGQDDGAGFNGALITVGGINDLPNPILPLGCGLDPRCDTERYTLSPPFVNQGDTTIKVDTLNPSNDDNIFFAWFNVASSTAVVGEGILLSPASATNPVGSTHTVTATVQDSNGKPISGKLVTFTVVSGPNAGTTGSATTDASGKASFTYTGSGGAGTDTIQASFVDATGKTVTSNTVTKDWTAPLGKISGLKFSDVNRNGKQDLGEPVLGGWTINLLDSKNNIIATKITAPDGTYSFDNLADGTYTVAEVPQLGWKQTMPSTGTYSETITGGNTIPDVNFGNTNTGSVSGLKFNDLNGNGKQDPGEPGIANWQIVLTDASGASVTTLTDSNGNYVFDPVVAGKYTISEVVTLGWKQTFPAAPGTYSITVNAGDNLANNNFGNVKIDGRMTGGGSVFMKDGTRVTHGFELNCNAANTPNNLEVNWGKNKFHLDTLNTAICYDDKAISPNPPSAGFDTYVGSGVGSYNGVSGATATWTFTDAGEPGKNDMATLHILDAKGNVVLDVSGLLKNGNQQAHPP